MADVVLFHHVQGLTEGVRELADHFRDSGHTVHTPDLFDGELPASVEEGMALVGRLGDDVIDERVQAALADLPERLVYAGISFGVMAAQRLAQTRPGALAALLYEACIPVTGDWAFGPGQAKLHVYPGDQHLFTDSSLPSYDVQAASLVRQRSLVFLDRLG